MVIYGSLQNKEALIGLIPDKIPLNIIGTLMLKRQASAVIMFVAFLRTQGSAYGSELRMGDSIFSIKRQNHSFYSLTRKRQLAN